MAGESEPCERRRNCDAGYEGVGNREENRDEEAGEEAAGGPIRACGDRARGGASVWAKARIRSLLAHHTTVETEFAKPARRHRTHHDDEDILQDPQSELRAVLWYYQDETRCLREHQFMRIPLVFFLLLFAVLWYFIGFWIALMFTLIVYAAEHKPDLISAAIGLGLLLVLAVFVFG